jgi:hypothetical protein
MVGLITLASANMQLLNPLSDSGLKNMSLQYKNTLSKFQDDISTQTTHLTAVFLAILF